MKIRLAGAVLIACTATLAQSADPPPGVVGADGWLFYRYEAADASASAEIKTSTQLIARIARALEHNGIRVVVTLVPVKMRIYARHLPATLKLTPYMAGQYQHMAKSFTAQDIRFVDLDAVFQSSAKRDSDTPLYLRLDTHWSPTGAMTAAEAIRAAIDADPALKEILDATPALKYRILWDETKSPSAANDLVQQLPKGAPPFESERVRGFQIEREAPAPGALLGDAVAPAITLVGSSYSAAWTQFADALGYTLQRDLLVVSVPANQGSWIGMESYLRDDAFQANPPKMIVWELPERDLRAPPNFKYREARYAVDNTEWLLRAAAWANVKCEPARTAVKSVGGALASASASREGEYLEIAFNRPLDKLEYLSARLTTHGASRVKLEPSGPGAAAHPFEITVPGDELAHAFRTPLYATAKGYDKVRLYPGATHLFKVEEVQVCRQMEGLLR